MLPAPIKNTRSVKSIGQMMVAAALNQIRKEGAVLAGLSMKLHAFFFFGNKLRLSVYSFSPVARNGNKDGKDQ